LARLQRSKRKALEQKQTVDWQAVNRDWDDYFQSGAAGDNWREEFLPVIEGVILDQGNAWNVAFGMQFNVRNLFAEEWFEDYLIKFAQDIDRTTNDNLTEMLQQAMREGWTVDQMRKQIDLQFDQYIEGNQVDCTRSDLNSTEQWFCDRQPRFRREMIARTETIKASNAGSIALFRDWGVVEGKEWLATGDDRTRDSHLVAWANYSEGGSPGPIPLEASFSIGGSSLMFPGDPRGAPSETVNCLAPWSSILAPDILAASRAFYEGPMLELTVFGGDKLAITPNHPILTARGFLAAKFINEGDDVIGCIDSQKVSKAIYQYNDHVPTAIEDIWSSFAVSGTQGHASYFKVVVPHDFYGDGRFMDGYVNVIGANSFLECQVNYASVSEHVTENKLNRGSLDEAYFFRQSFLTKLRKRALFSSHRSMGVGSKSQSFLGSHALHAKAVCLTDAAPWNIGFSEPSPKNGARYASLAREFLFRFAGLVTKKKIIKIRNFDFSGHVYDLQTISQLYISNTILVKNCRCTVLPFFSEAAGTAEQIAQQQAIIAEEQERRRSLTTVAIGRAPTGSDMTTGILDQWLAGGVDWRNATEAQRAEIKNELIEALASRSGASYEDVNRFVKQWSISSNDFDMRSLAIQQDAAKQFNIPLSEFSTGKINELQAQFDEFLEIMPREAVLETVPQFSSLLSSAEQMRILDSMHSYTQEQLAEAGFGPGDIIRLRRGVGLPDDVIQNWSVGDETNVVGNVLESWSVGKDIAEDFARRSGRKRGQTGIVFEMDVPIELIVGTARTGFGALTEGEFVIQGIQGTGRVVNMFGGR
jgi:hypothetical protein